MANHKDMLAIFLSSFILNTLFVLPVLLLAEDTLTITTYYPSPYGSYNKLQTNSLGVGDNDNDGRLGSGDVPTTVGDVWIKGKVGIGIRDPAQKLSVAGTIESTSGGFKFPNSTIQTTAVVIGPQVYQCPASCRGSCNGGAWGYYSCTGQITTSSTCETIEWPCRAACSCVPLGYLAISS